MDDVTTTDEWSLPKNVDNAFECCSAAAETAIALTTNVKVKKKKKKS